MPSSSETAPPIDEQLADVAELATRLERILTEQKEGRGCFVPSYLIDALLRIETPIPAQYLHQVTAIIHKYEANIVRSLNTNSVRCLAYLLLNLDAETEQETGLALLLDESSYVRDSKGEKSDVTLLRFRSQSQTVQRKLIQTLYCIFVDETRDKRLRRLAGKLLVEILPESKDVSSVLSNTPDHDPFRKVASIFLNESDATMRFFAGTFIHILHLSGTDAEHLWDSNDAGHKDLYMKNLKAFPEDPVDSFYHYEREVQRLETISERSAILIPSCQLVQFGKDDDQTLAQGTILVLVNTESLTFIHAVTCPSGRYYQFIRISMRSTFRCQTSKRRTDEGLSQLMLHFDAEASVSVNGKRQVLKASTLSITSVDDLNELQTTIDTTGKQLSRQSTELSSLTSLTRRSSSIIISLDTDEEIARKSFNHDLAFVENEEHHSLYISAAKDNPSGNMKQKAIVKTVCHDSSCLSGLPETTRMTSPIGGNLQSSNCGSLNHDDAVEKDTFPEPSAGTGGMSSSRNDGKELLAMKSFGESAKKLHNGFCDGESTDTKTLAKKDDSPLKSEGHQSKEPEAKTIQPPLMEGSQKKGVKDQLKMSSSTRKSQARALIPGTQESLIFPMRRSARKLYTHSRGTVDWDEDLRPSDGAEGPASQNSELTSISSPLPGKKILFERKTTKKRTRRTGQIDSSARKRRKTSQAKKPKKGGPPGAQPSTEKIGLTSDSRLEGAKNAWGRTECEEDESKASEEGHTKAHREIDVPGVQEESASGPEDSAEDGPDNGLVADTEMSGVERNIAFLFDQAQYLGYSPTSGLLKGNSSEARGEHFDQQSARDLLGDHEPQSNVEQGPKNNEQVGRGKAVGEKLAAALHDDSSSSPKGFGRKARNSSTASHEDKNSEEQKLEGKLESEKEGNMLAQHELPIMQQNKIQLPNNLHHEPLVSSAGRMDRPASVDSSAQEYQEGSNTRAAKARWSMSHGGRKRRADHTIMDNSSRKKRVKEKPIILTKCVSRDQSEGSISHVEDSYNTRGSESQSRDPKETEFGYGLSWSPTNGRRSTAPRCESSGSQYTEEESGNEELTVSTVLSAPCHTAQTLKPTPRKTIVDKNGSPRLGSSRRAVECQHFGHTGPSFDQRHEQAKQAGASFVQSEVNESGYEADFDEIPEEGDSRSRGTISSFRYKMDACRRETLPDKCEAATHRSCSEKGESPSEGTGNKKYTSRIVTSTGKEFTLYFASLPPPKEPKPASGLGSLEADGDIPTQSSSGDDLCSVHSSSESSACGEELPDQADLQKSLQSIHENAHEMLMKTNKELLHQLDKERAAVSKVLDSYRQQYHRVLDQLFARQEERIKLCKQHMKTIREHHADLCQELFRRLRENEQHLLKNFGREDPTF